VEDLEKRRRRGRERRRREREREEKRKKKDVTKDNVVNEHHEKYKEPSFQQARMPGALHPPTPPPS
jgi:hypothetical protein